MDTIAILAMKNLHPPLSPLYNVRIGRAEGSNRAKGKGERKKKRKNRDRRREEYLSEFSCPLLYNTSRHDYERRFESTTKIINQ